MKITIVGVPTKAKVAISRGGCKTATPGVWGEKPIDVIVPPEVEINDEEVAVGGDGDEMANDVVLDGTFDDRPSDPPPAEAEKPKPTVKKGSARKTLSLLGEFSVDEGGGKSGTVVVKKKC